MQEIDPIARQMLPQFLKNRERDAALLITLLAETNWEEIRRIAHNMKGTGGAFGLMQISDIGDEMEQAALRHDENAINTGVQKLEATLGTLSKEFA